MFSQHKNDKKPSLHAKMLAEVDRLQQAVSTFNYAELRSIERATGKNKFFSASEEAIKALYDMFVHTFRNDPDKKISSYFKSLSMQPVEAKEVVLKLAETLLTFRNRIQEQERKYFSTEPFGEDLSQLQKNDTWVSYFHYVIEQYLIKTPSFSSRDYNLFIKNLKILARDSYYWMQEHFPEQSERYNVFKAKDEFEFKKINAGSPTSRYFASKENKATESNKENSPPASPTVKYSNKQKSVANDAMDSPTAKKLPRRLS